MEEIIKPIEELAFKAKYYQEYLKPQDQAQKFEEISLEIKSSGEKLIEEYEQKLHSLESNIEDLCDERDYLQEQITSVQEKINEIIIMLPHIDKRDDLKKELDYLLKIIE